MSILTDETKQTLYDRLDDIKKLKKKRFRLVSVAPFFKKILNNTLKYCFEDWILTIVVLILCIIFPFLYIFI